VAVKPMQAMPAPKTARVIQLVMFLWPPAACCLCLEPTCCGFFLWHRTFLLDIHSITDNERFAKAPPTAGGQNFAQS